MTKWTIEIRDKAAKVLRALDAPTKRRIDSFLDNLESTENPRTTGKALQGRLSGYWRLPIDLSN